MSSSARSRPPASKAAEERADGAPLLDPDIEGPQDPKSSTTIADALSTTTAVLSSQNPDVATLQSDCDLLIAGNRDTALRDDNLLKLVSMYGYEETLDKLQATHPDGGLSYNYFSYKIHSAKTGVASARGVNRQQIVDVVKRNQQLSGLLKRRGEVRGRRAVATRKERKEALAGDPEEGDAEVDDGAPVEVKSSASRNWWRTHISVERREEVEDEDLEGDELPTSSAGDELARTTAALSARKPHLIRLQSECEALFKLDPKTLTGETLLKVVSIFTFEETFNKLTNAHGAQVLTYGGITGRVREAKATVAKARGVDRNEIDRELKKNQYASGATERKNRLLAVRRKQGLEVSRNGVTIGDEEDEDATNQIASFLGQVGDVLEGAGMLKAEEDVERLLERREAKSRNGPARKGDVDVEDGTPLNMNRGEGFDGSRPLILESLGPAPGAERSSSSKFSNRSSSPNLAAKATQGPGTNGQPRLAQEVDGDEENEISNDVDRRQPVQNWPSLLPSNTVPPGGIEPFDPRPVGPGTPFFVRGFRTDDTMTPEEWMRLHPGPY